MDKSTMDGTIALRFGVYTIWDIDGEYYIFDWSGSQCGNGHHSVRMAVAWLRNRGVSDPK